MLIQITTITGELVETITIEQVSTSERLIYWPCHYCGMKLVRAPRKFCCASHRVIYCQKRIGQCIA